MNNTRNITDAELTEKEEINFLADESGTLKKMGLLYLAGLISGGIYNTITDPDRFPVEEGGQEDEKPEEISPLLELGGLSKSKGTTVERNDAVRTADFIAVSGGTYTFSNGAGYKICIICYDNTKTIIAGWAGGGLGYAYVNDGTEFTLPSSAVYLKFYCSDTADISHPFIMKNSGGGSIKGKVFEFVKQYFAKGAYNISCTELDPGLWQLEIRSKKEGFAILAIKPPAENPQEATLALSLSGENTKQFVDFSCMRYQEAEQGQVCIICQKRGAATPLPYFFIGFNDGAGAGRVQKFRVDPNSIPVRLTSEGIKVRRNNNYDNNWTEEDTVTINLANLHDKVEKMYSILVANGIITE